MMKYKNAADVLPDKLLREIQKYASGEAIYIPQAKEKSGWGTKSGAHAYYKKRNEEICTRYAEGETADALAEAFGLSPKSIRKIIYSGREKEKQSAVRGVCPDEDPKI